MPESADSRSLLHAIITILLTQDPESDRHKCSSFFVMLNIFLSFLVSHQKCSSRRDSRRADADSIRSVPSVILFHVLSQESAFNTRLPSPHRFPSARESSTLFLPLSLLRGLPSAEGKGKMATDGRRVVREWSA